MIRSVTGAAVAGIILAVAAVAVVLSLWQVGWWFHTENTQRQTHLNRESYGFQQAARDRITTEIEQVFTVNTELPNADPDQTGPLEAQRKAITAMVCRDATQISGDPLPTDQEVFLDQNCSAGAVSPTSTYNS